MTAKHEDSKIIKLDKEQIIEKIKTALDKSNMVVKEINAEEGIIRAKAKLNFWSWSENIHIDIADDGTGRVVQEFHAHLRVDKSKSRNGKGMVRPRQLSIIFAFRISRAVGAATSCISLVYDNGMAHSMSDTTHADTFRASERASATTTRVKLQCNYTCF